MKAIAFAVIALCVASTAQAQSPRRFDRIDSDHDGRISLQEFESAMGNRLMKGKGRFAEKFRALDPEQQATALQRRFHKLDKDHKGYLIPGDFPRRHQG